MTDYSPIFQEEIGNSKWDIEKICDKDGSVEIKLRDEIGNELNILFQSYFSYRKIDEGDAHRILSEISAGGSITKLLYVTKESDFIRWFGEESFHTHSKQDLKHYVVASINEIFEIISIDSPEFK